MHRTRRTRLYAPNQDRHPSNACRPAHRHQKHLTNCACVLSDCVLHNTNVESFQFISHLKRPFSAVIIAVAFCVMWECVGGSSGQVVATKAISFGRYNPRGHIAHQTHLHCSNAVYKWCCILRNPNPSFAPSNFCTSDEVEQTLPKDLSLLTSFPTEATWQVDHLNVEISAQM